MKHIENKKIAWIIATIISTGIFALGLSQLQSENNDIKNIKNKTNENYIELSENRLNLKESTLEVNLNESKVISNDILSKNVSENLPEEQNNINKSLENWHDQGNLKTLKTLKSLNNLEEINDNHKIMHIPAILEEKKDTATAKQQKY